MMYLIKGAPRTYDPIIEYWFQDDQGLTHCEDGPAFKWHGEEPEWYIHGRKLSCKTQEEFERVKKLKVFW